MKQARMGRKLLAALVGSALAAGLVVSAPAVAQLSTSTIHGHVVLGTQGAKAGAQVVATNTATRYSARAVTRDDGSYALTGLPPGSYRIEISGTW